MRSSRGPIVFGLLVILVVGILLSIDRDSQGAPLDPRGTSPSGARAVLELVDSLGGTAEIVRSVPPADTDVALLLADQVGDLGRTQLDEWLSSGGRLIVADVNSSFTPPVVGGDGDPDGVRVDPEVCNEAALEGIGSLELESVGFYAVGTGSRSCFGSGASSYVVVEDQGAGTLVSVGGPDVFLNGQLGAGDNSVLVATLLVPEPGTRVAFVEGFPYAGGEKGLWDLVAPPVRWGLLLGLIALVVFALVHARRLGRPVAEPLPVELYGSDLVLAVARVLDRNGETAAATERILADGRRRLALGHGLPPDVAPHALAEIVAARTGTPIADVVTMLAGDGRDERAMLAAIDGIDRITQGNLRTKMEESR